MRAHRKRRLVRRPVRRSWLIDRSYVSRAVADGATLAAGGGEVYLENTRTLLCSSPVYGCVTTDSSGTRRDIWANRRCIARAGL